MTVVAAFYKFVSLPDCAELQAPLLQVCLDHDLRGTILLAAEGINGTIAGSRSQLGAVLQYLKSDPRLTDLSVREAQAAAQPFGRMKVKLKREIVTLGQPEVNPNQQVGQYVEPQQWNQLLADPDTVVIDTRNEFEVRMGSFQGATDPKTRSFRQFPDYVHQQLQPGKPTKVAMFCTGGIRCEKATSYLLSQGFEEVYHLKGGILRYLEEVPPEDSLWQGDCFVFDERIAVTHGLEPISSYEFCAVCGSPLSAADRAAPEFRAGEQCPYCCDRNGRDLAADADANLP